MLIFKFHPRTPIDLCDQLLVLMWFTLYNLFLTVLTGFLYACICIEAMAIDVRAHSHSTNYIPACISICTYAYICWIWIWILVLVSIACMHEWPRPCKLHIYTLGFCIRKCCVSHNAQYIHARLTRIISSQHVTPISHFVTWSHACRSPSCMTHHQVKQMETWKRDIMHLEITEQR